MTDSTVRLLFVGDAASAVRSVRQLESAFGSLQTTSRIVSGAIGIGLAGAVAEAGKQAVSFDRSMRNVNSLAQLSEKQFASLEKQVLSFAKTAGKSPTDLANGLYDIVSSGFKANDALKILKQTSIAATAGLTDTATATKAVVAILNAYHLGADKARNVSSLLFREVDKGVNTFAELAQNIGDTAPQAAALKVPFADVAAGLATITLHGTSMAEASTQMSRVLAALIKPSQGLRAELNHLGYESGQAAVQAIGFTGVLQALSKEADGNQEKLAKWIPDIRGLRGLLNLTGANLQTFTGFVGDLSNAYDKGQRVQQVYAEQSKSISVQWDKARASLEAAAVPIGQLLFPALEKAAKEAEHLASELTAHKDEIKQTFAAIGRTVSTLASDFKPVVQAVDDLVQVKVPGGTMVSYILEGTFGLKIAGLAGKLGKGAGLAGEAEAAASKVGLVGAALAALPETVTITLAIMAALNGKKILSWVGDKLTGEGGGGPNQVTPLPALAGTGLASATKAGIPPTNVTKGVGQFGAAAINNYTSRFGGGVVPPALVAAILQQESGGYQKYPSGPRKGQLERSSAGALGAMQVLPGTAAGLGIRDVTDVENNLQAGITYFAQLMQRYKGDVAKALQAYNAGPGTLARNRSAGAGYAASVLSLARGGFGASLGQTPPTSTASQTNLSGGREKLIKLAMSMLGKPYLWGGTSPDGFDCSGLVMWAFAQEGITLPHFTGSQMAAGAPVAKNKIQPGDVVFTNFGETEHGQTLGANVPGHEGLYVGGGNILEAPGTGGHVQVVPLAQFVGTGRYAIRSFFPAHPSAARANVKIPGTKGGGVTSSGPSYAYPSQFLPHALQVQLADAQATGTDAQQIKLLEQAQGDLVKLLKTAAGARRIAIDTELGQTKAAIQALKNGGQKGLSAYAKAMAQAAQHPTLSYPAGFDLSDWVIGNTGPNAGDAAVEAQNASILHAALAASAAAARKLAPTLNAAGFSEGYGGATPLKPTGSGASIVAALAQNLADRKAGIGTGTNMLAALAGIPGGTIVQEIGKYGQSLGTTTAASLTGQVQKLLASLKAATTPAQVTRALSGFDSIAGYITQALTNANDAAQKKADQLTQTLQTAADNARTDFEGSLSTEFNDALQVFDAETQKLLDDAQAKAAQLTPTEQKLQDEQDAHDEAARQQAIQDAKTALAQAQAGGTATTASVAAQALQQQNAQLREALGIQNAQETVLGGPQTAIPAAPQAATAADPAAVAAAQKQLDDALYQEQLAADQKQANLERQQANADLARQQNTISQQRAAQREGLQESYDAIVQNFERGNITAAQAQSDLVGVIQANVPEMTNASDLLGKAFSETITGHFKTAYDNAKAYADAISQLNTATGGSSGPEPTPSVYVPDASVAQNNPFTGLPTIPGTNVPTIDSINKVLAQAGGLVGFARGTLYVPETGTYTLHAGEKVIPPGAAAAYQPASDGGSIEHAHVHLSLGDDLDRIIETRVVELTPKISLSIGRAASRRLRARRT